MSLKTWIVLLTNVLLLVAVSSVSFLFYNEFKSALDQRVLLQVSSIKTLKHKHIETGISEQLAKFYRSDEGTWVDIHHKIGKSKLKDLLTKEKPSGVYDVSNILDTENVSLLFVKKKGDQFRIKIEKDPGITEILTERTGMGQSGETYLVNPDKQLVSESRFFTKTKGTRTTVDTRGVNEAFSNKEGMGLYPDYRDIRIYGSYAHITISHIDWAILSEIDENEVLVPLHSLRRNLLMIVLVTLILACVVSTLIAQRLSRPISKIAEKLTALNEGDYDVEIEEERLSREVRQLSVAANDLSETLNNAVEYIDEINKSDFETTEASPSARSRLMQALINLYHKQNIRKKKTKNSEL